MNESVESAQSVQEAQQLLHRVQSEIRKALIGQDEVINQALVSLLADGHVLIEGVPGLGKTLLVCALARCFNGSFARIQFTPDLMPSDITGHEMFDMAQQTFKVRKGPAFTNLLLADEINRAPAKTQAALLEVMQECQITIEGTAHTLDKPFMTFATQNPVEQEGTYPLPEAELDRFLMKIQMGYPEEDDEVRLVQSSTNNRSGSDFNIDQVENVLSTDQVRSLQQLSSQTRVDDEVLAYAVRILRSTRDWMGLSRGGSPRASIALVRAAKAQALLDGKNFVTPDEIKHVALPVLRHRVVLSTDLEIEGVVVDEVLTDLLNSVEAPRR
jgi:MoxR-like ATPase